MPSSEEGLSGGDVVTVKHELKNGKSGVCKTSGIYVHTLLVSLLGGFSSVVS